MGDDFLDEITKRCPFCDLIQEIITHLFYNNLLDLSDDNAGCVGLIYLIRNPFLVTCHQLLTADLETAALPPNLHRYCSDSYPGWG
jgi:hypothetical protein